MRDTNILLAKVEAPYGTDAAPAAATDALIVYDWQPRPMIYDEVRRNIERGFAGATPKMKTRGRQGHAFKVELCGSGAAATATKWGSVLLRACGFGAPVPNGVIDNSYPLVTADDGSSLTIHGWKDQLRLRAQGFRSNAKFVFVAGELPYIEFDGLGLLNNVPDQAAPTAPTLPDYPAPVEVNTANTTFSLGGFAAKLRSFELDLRMKVEYRDLVGQREVMFGKSEDGDRRAAGGQLVIELPDPTTKSYFADVANRTNLALGLVHGTAAGNIVDLGSTLLNLDEPTFSVEQNRLMMTATYDLVPSAAGNEFTLKTK